MLPLLQLCPTTASQKPPAYDDAAPVGLFLLGLPVSRGGFFASRGRHVEQIGVKFGVGEFQISECKRSGKRKYLA